MEEGMRPEDARLSKEEIKELGEQFHLKLTDPEIEKLHDE